MSYTIPESEWADLKQRMSDLELQMNNCETSDQKSPSIKSILITFGIVCAITTAVSSYLAYQGYKDMLKREENSYRISCFNVAESILHSTGGDTITENQFYSAFPDHVTLEGCEKLGVGLPVR